MLFIIFIFEIPLFCGAQELAFRHYSTSDGLPSSEVYCVVQDSMGYIWFGTDRGVVRFDGHSFFTYTSADGMPDNTVFGLYEDYRGWIWFSSYTGKVGYFYNGKPYVYRHNDKVKSVMKSGIAKGNIAVDPKGRLWVCHLEGVNNLSFFLNCIDSTGSVHESPYSPEKGIRDICVAGTGYCLLRGDLINSKEARVLSLQNGKTLFRFSTGSAKDAPTCSFIEKDGNVWIYHNGQIWSFKDGRSVKRVNVEDDVLSFAVDEQKNLWLGSRHSGIRLYLADKNYKEPINLLKAYSVSGICIDREQGKWFTTLENGVFYLPPNLYFSYGAESGLRPANTLQLENYKGDVVAVQSNFKMSIKKRENRIFENLSPENSARVYRLKTGRGDTLYFTGPGPGKILLPGKQIQLPRQNLFLSRGGVWSIAGPGLGLSKTNGNTIKQWYFQNQGRVTCVFDIDEERHFLLGTIEGLFEIRGDSIISLGQVHPLLNSRISGILDLGKGHLAVSTIGQGMLLLRSNDFHLTHHYKVKEGLPGVMCNVMLKQNDSVLWLGTNKGLCRIEHAANPAQAKFRTIDIHDGLVSNEITDLLQVNGALWVATQNGITVLSKPDAVQKVEPPPLLIEKVALNGKEIRLGRDSVFQFGQNNLTISFTALNFQHPGEIKYKYRLSGSDSSWKVTQLRSLIYNSIPPGAYEFELKMIGPDGIEFETVRRLRFTILAPYWQSWWFLFLVLFALSICIYGFVSYRITLVKKRAQLLRDLDSYRDKALRSQMNPHFIYNSMNAIQNYITKNETEVSVDFLTRFSRLMRLTFQNSYSDLVRLGKDIEALRLYAQIESIRFPGRFTFCVKISNAVNADRLVVPPLLLQPFVENAILHAFSGLERRGNIMLEIDSVADKLIFSILDDGIGRSAAMEFERRKRKYRPIEHRKESGISITAARIKQVWGKKYSEATFRIDDLIDKLGNATGTCVKFYLPINYDETNFS